MAAFLKRFSWLVIILLLVACGTLSPAPVGTPTASSTPTKSPIPATATALPTFPFSPTLTPNGMNALPTLSPYPTIPFSETLTPTGINATPTSTPFPTLLPLFPLNGYVMLFNKDGNLYFQDGNNPPIKLALNVNNPYDPFPLNPELSSDNKKVVFSQEDGSIDSIDTDGTSEQIIIPNEWLNSQETGTSIDALKFIPRTHLLFLQTVLCKSKSSVSLCSASIFLADADTGKIRNLADLGLVLQNDGLSPNIVISPDGRMVAVGTIDGVKIFTLDGRIIRNNVLPYTPDSNYGFFPSLFWLPDSSGLIVALPNANYHDPILGESTAYTIWRYMIDGNSIDQILLDPPPLPIFLQVSPDGKWIVYGNLYPSPLYLGNLINGHTQVFGADQTPNFYWSPDSKHLIDRNIVYTSFDQPFVYAGGNPEWIDSTHYIYSILPTDNSSAYPERVLIAEIRGDAIVYYESGLLHPSFVMIRPK